MGEFAFSKLGMSSRRLFWGQSFQRILNRNKNRWNGESLVLQYLLVGVVSIFNSLNKGAVLGWYLLFAMIQMAFFPRGNFY
jgi:hypothetical protein